MKKRFTEERIIGFLKEADAGLPVAELCCKHGFSDASYYKWKAKIGGMGVPDAKRFKTLEEETTGSSACLPMLCWTMPPRPKGRRIAKVVARMCAGRPLLSSRRTGSYPDDVPAGSSTSRLRFFGLGPERKATGRRKFGSVHWLLNAAVSDTGAFLCCSSVKDASSMPSGSTDCIVWLWGGDYFDTGRKVEENRRSSIPARVCG